MALLLAASILAVAGIWWLPREEPLRRGEHLGRRVECLTPRGSVLEFGAFVWRSALPERGYFVVTIYDSERRHVVLAESPRLQVPSWTPTVALPREIYWEIRVFDVRGEALEWGAARAERR
ncbi:MAG: hypothetical protein JNM84_06685 [Planctomycetes bacterium]|nr:hypothetical protein [Planctomycetota bacterium]